MTKNQLKKLYYFLEDKLEFKGKGRNLTWKCGNSHKWTRYWLEDNGLHTEENFKQIQDLGGRCCDCEFVFNFKG